MVAPEYQELLNKDIPKASENGVSVVVIAGESLGKKVRNHLQLPHLNVAKSIPLLLTCSLTFYPTQSPVRTRTPTTYLDFKLESGAKFFQPVCRNWTAFIYILSGEGKFGPAENATTSNAHHTLVLGDGDHVEFENIVSCNAVI